MVSMMEALNENLTEIQIGSSVESFQKFLESQKELFHSQIVQLQSIVVTQCRLTGANPLSQEMAAGALSIKIGKRPRDLLNPKAVTYMQSVFSIKDAITKKESREISAQFGVTITQVRDFFNSQRTRVRKLVRLSREKAIRAKAHQEQPDRTPTSCDAIISTDPVPLSYVAPDPVNGNSLTSCPGFLDSGGIDSAVLNSGCTVVVPESSSGGFPVPLNSIAPNPVPLNFSWMNPVSRISVAPDTIPLSSVGPNPVPLNSVGRRPVPLNSVGPNPVPLNSVAPNPVPLGSIGPNPVPLDSVHPSNVEDTPSCSTQDEILPGLDGLDRRFVEDIFYLLRKEETFSGQVKLMERILQIQNPTVLNWFLMKGGVMILATWLSEAAAEEQTSVLLVTLEVLCHLPLHKALPEHMSAILQSVNKLRFYRTSDISNRARLLVSRWSKIFARSQAVKKPNGMRSSTDAQEMILKQSINEIMGNELWRPNVDNHDNAPTLPLEGSGNIRKMEASQQSLKLLPASADDPNRKHVLGMPSSHNRERRKVQLVEQPGQKTAGRSPQATKSAPVNQSRPMSADDIQKAKVRALYMQQKYGKTGSPSKTRNDIKTGGLNKPSTSSTTSTNLPQVSKVPRKIEELKKIVISPQIISTKHEGSLDQLQKTNLKQTLGEICNRAEIHWQTPPEVKLSDLWRVGSGENSKEVDVQKHRNRREMETIYRTIQEIPSNPKEPWDLEMDYDDSLTLEIPIEQPPDVDGAETQVPHNESVNPVIAAAPPLPSTAGGGNAGEPDLELLAVLLKNPQLVFTLTSGQAGNGVNEETVKLLDMIKTGGDGLAGLLIGGKAEEKVEVSLPSPTPSSNPGTSGWRPEVAKNPFSQQRSGPMVNRVGYNDTPAENLTNLLRLQQQLSMASPSQQVPAPLHPHSYPQTNHITPETVNRTVFHPSHQNHPTNSSMVQMPTSEMNHMGVITPSMRYETSPAFALSAPERRQVSFPMSQQLHMAEPLVVYPGRGATGNVGHARDSWRVRQGLGSNSFSQVNQNNYDPLIGGRNEYESWSPEDSPSSSRSQQEYNMQLQGGNYSGLRTNTGWEYRPDDNMPRQRNSSSGYPDPNRNGNRRWR